MKVKKHIIGIISVFVLSFIILINRGNIGVSKYNMEKDARK